MQFGPGTESSAEWCFPYPCNLANRFERRLANAEFIMSQVKAVEHAFTHLIFVHVSMQFGLIHLPLRKGLEIWTFPMFLTPSYIASGEIVPEKYRQMEQLTLSMSKQILTPSHLERCQLVDHYSIPVERIHVVPRGVETKLLVPKIRTRSGPPKFCSVGSIKPQKNTIGLLRLFTHAQARFPGAKLKIIGPVQDSGYGANVRAEIARLGLKESVELTGYIPPDQLSSAIDDTHIHLSASTCETFGRSIFETLASGLPNIAKATGNAAAEYLQHLPYARFVR